MSSLHKFRARPGLSLLDTSTAPFGLKFDHQRHNVLDYRYLTVTHAGNPWVVPHLSVSVITVVFDVARKLLMSLSTFHISSLVWIVVSEKLEVTDKWVCLVRFMIHRRLIVGHFRL